jgi:ribonuclease T
MANKSWLDAELNESLEKDKPLLAYRFRGYLPVVIDIETAGFNANTDALLEIAATFLDMDDNGKLSIKESISFDIEPFAGANLEQAALDFTGIDPYDPARAAEDESDVLKELFREVRREVKLNHCKRAIVVAHNASFDQGFLNAAATRCNIKRNPFHPFSSFDTATLAGFAYGHTVLAQACKIAGIPFSNKEAHSAAYDAEVTAKLFCKITNQWRDYGGWDNAVEAQIALQDLAESDD